MKAPKSGLGGRYLRTEAPGLDREEPSVDEQTSQQNEDTYSTRVDEPEPVVESDGEWLDDDAED